MLFFRFKRLSQHFRLTPRLLEQLMLGNVVRRRDQRSFAVEGNGTRRKQASVFIPFSIDQHHFLIFDSPLIVKRLPYPHMLFTIHPEIGGWPSDDLAPIAAKLPARGFVGVDNRTVTGIRNREPRRNHVCNRAEAFLALAQRLLGLLTFGNILRSGDDSGLPIEGDDTSREKRSALAAIRLDVSQFIIPNKSFPVQRVLNGF